MLMEAHTRSPSFSEPPPPRLRSILRYHLINLQLCFILAYAEILLYIKAKNLVSVELRSLKDYGNSS